MKRLRVRNPDTLTRVTEYVPEIVSFVEQIIKNGYGYEFDGSVYFDTNAFDKAEGHDYAKLEPWSKGNRALLEEGEGQMSVAPSHSVIHSFATQAPCPRKAAAVQVLILLSGRLPNQASRPGHRHGALVVQDGTSSAPSWPVPYWATIWTFIRVAATWRSRIMITRWPSLK